MNKINENLKRERVRERGMKRSVHEYKSIKFNRIERKKASNTLNNHTNTKKWEEEEETDEVENTTQQQKKIEAITENKYLIILYFWLRHITI